MFSEQADLIRNRDDRGAMMLEYGALLVLVVVAAFIALSAFGATLLELLTDNAEQYNAAVKRNVG